MSDGSFSENQSENNISPSANIDELDSEVSVDQLATRIKTSVTSNITRKIKSKLPTLAYFLKRLMRLKSGENRGAESETGGSSSEVTEITEGMLNRVILEISSASTINEQTIPEDENSDGGPGCRVVEPRSHEVRYGASSNHFTELGSEGPSTSTTNADGEYHTSTTVVQTEPLQVIGNSVNTVEAMTTNGTFVNVLNRDTSAAGSILEFTEALSTHLGTQTERLRSEESRTVPLVYIQSEDRHELYLQSTVNGESGISGSSTIGSEISSMSEGEYPQMRNRRIGQDTIPAPYYDPMLGVDRVIRKPICRKDDEPTIY